MPPPDTLERIQKNTGRKSPLRKSSSKRFDVPISEPDSSRPIKPTREEIASLAYCLFEERGRADGYDVEDWLTAEAHLCTDEKHCAHRDSRDQAG